MSDHDMTKGEVEHMLDMVSDAKIHLVTASEDSLDDAKRCLENWAGVLEEHGDLNVDAIVTLIDKAQAAIDEAYADLSKADFSKLIESVKKETA